MIFITFFIFHAHSQAETASCAILSDGTPKVTMGIDKENSDAWAYWNNSISEIGWYTLHVEGREGASSHNMLRCAGLLEGYLSQHEIFLHFQLMKDIHGFDRTTDYSPEWRYFMEKNMNYTFSSVQAYLDDPYWRDINLTLTQFNGLLEGYNMKREEREKKGEIEGQMINNEIMTPLDFWFLEAECELYDVEMALIPVPESATAPTKSQNKNIFGNSQKNDHSVNNGNSLNSERNKYITKKLNKLPTKKTQNPPNGDDCTGLIRLLPDYSDIFFSQDTWSDFRDLHGELKEYHFPIPGFKANRILFSTRVGKLFSYDDFYIADSGLLVLETTMSIFNLDLYKEVIPESLFTWLRATRSMWHTDNGKDWATEFIKHNSGTLNNQYIILDQKKFTRFEKPEKDLLWMIEQYPGDYESRDLTDLLVKNGYFPSINVPFTERLYEKAGYPEKVKSSATGDFFSYYDSARFKILDRESRRIMNFEDFKKLMTYNNYQRDPYSKGDPAQAIMSRYDLRRPGEPYGPAKAFGGLDSKCCRITEFATKLHFHAIASPTKDNQEPWEFGKPPFENVRYEGLPKRWDFNWTTFESMTYNFCGNFTSEKDCTKNDLCGWCTYDTKCFAGDKTGPFFDVKCEAGWKVKVVSPSWATPVIAATCGIVLVFVIAVYSSHFVMQKRKKLL
ncbi:Laminin A family protein [Tritrichomonas foetus]|uniref:Phospholipase B-like n=1 Tax=Tritrichomonas foetus TaxID=1144522 RepID=A0A1J4KZJ4_9EUKA|nr:Laminin A family protein [Tritrichomonas foetus]|eukprot:OHT16675.1 Laminin A family protein [Tritrichomonas foetus]